MTRKLLQKYSRDLTKQYTLYQNRKICGCFQSYTVVTQNLTTGELTPATFGGPNMPGLPSVLDKARAYYNGLK